jgi:DNA-binding FrmR family transcriptional regulator
MAHTIQNKTKLLSRVRRIRGQVEAVERALEGGKACGEVLQCIAAARGAMNGLMAEILEGHIRVHVTDPARESDRVRGADELIDIVRAYLK